MTQREKQQTDYFDRDKKESFSGRRQENKINFFLTSITSCTDLCTEPY